MHDLDETDMEILRLLGEDARRPFSDIGEAVDLSGPAVSDRVSRLQEAGVLERFTVEVDRSQLAAGVPVFVQVRDAGDVEEVASAIRAASAVEHTFVTADGEVWFAARVSVEGVHDWLDALLGEFDVSYDVTLLDEVAWDPSLEDAAFALSCVECGNTVDDEGTSTRIDGDVYHFCCPSCQRRFTERYERLEEGA